jgi:antitoxin ParD1/3/4
MEINIAPYYKQFIINEMASGKFNNEAEIIQAGLALLEKEQTQMSILSKAILDGEKSGFALPFNNEEFKKRMEAKYAK